MVLYDVPEENEETRGDKDPVEGDRVAVPEPLLLKLGLVEANAKGRVPGICCTLQSQCHDVMFILLNINIVMSILGVVAYAFKMLQLRPLLIRSFSKYRPT